jgi:hypothetical protein
VTAEKLRQFPGIGLSLGGEGVIAFLQGGSPFQMKVSNPTLPRIGSRTAPQPLTRNGPPSEYIFDLEKAIVVETPQLGHATYVFAKPRSMEGFLALYTRITKEDIRRNRDNVGERLGFLGRVAHGTNPRAWLKEMRQRLGEKIDFASAVAD